MAGQQTTPKGDEIQFTATEIFMRNNFLGAKLALIAFALGLFLSLSLPAAAEPKNEIKAMADEWVAAFSAHDVDRIVKLYSNDALLWGTNAISLRTTPDEVRGFFLSAFKIPNIKVAFDNQTIRLFGNVAVVAGNYTFTAGQDGQTSNSSARYSFTLFNDGGRWVIIDHNSSLLPGSSNTRRT
jgi:uncharacterized protein (TIGR02246 family)